MNNPRPGLGVVIEKISWKKEEMFLQAKTSITLHRRVFDWFRRKTEKKEIGVKVGCFLEQPSCCKLQFVGRRLIVGQLGFSA